MNASEINEFFNTFYKLNHERNSYNPYLRISKATKSKMNFYEISRMDLLIYRRKYLKLILPIVLILRFAFNLIYNLIRFIIYRKPKNVLNKVDVLLLSHLTPRNLISPQDSFYGSIPQDLMNSGKKIAIIYTNQIRNLSKDSIKRIESENTLVIPKYLGFQEYIRFFKIAIKSIRYTQDEMKSYQTLESKDQTLIVKACFSFLKIDSMMNFHLIEKTKEAINDCRPNYVFVTLEGHIYENSIYLNCKKNPDVNRILMFQNSPIGPSQFGLFDFVKQNEEKLTYLVQGNAYKNLILDLNKSSHVLVIGRKGEKLDLNPKSQFASSSKLILVPDGDKSNVFHFLNMIEFFHNQISTNIEISLHPDTHIGLINSIKLYRLKQKGFIKRSTSNLSTENLTEYGALAYTSSNLAIKSLLMEIEVIYINDSKYNLDPLWLINLNTTSVINKNYIKYNSRVFAKREYQNYYAEFNNEPLLKLLTP
jgi:hypothetical protein